MNHLLELLMLKETNLEHSMYRSTNSLWKSKANQDIYPCICLYKDIRGYYFFFPLARCWISRMDCFISEGQFYKELQENILYEDFFSQTEAQGGGI